MKDAWHERILLARGATFSATGAADAHLRFNVVFSQQPRLADHLAQRLRSGERACGVGQSSADRIQRLGVDADGRQFTVWLISTGEQSPEAATSTCRARATPTARSRPSSRPRATSSPQHGLGGARMDRIAERAGLNKRLIYYYFGNKDDLFLAVLEDTYLRHPRGREATAPDRPAARRGGAPAHRVHLELLPRAPGVPHSAEQRKPAPREPPRTLGSACAN